MQLTLERLLQFDLLEEAEKQLKSDNFDLLIDFFATTQQIQSIDQFIKDSPSFPASTDKILRAEMISAVGATLAIEGTVLAQEDIEESFRKADLNETLSRQQQEAQNSKTVYQFVIDLVRKSLSDFVYSEQMIKQIHSYFTADLNYLSNVPGAYRQNFKATFGYPRREGLCRTTEEIERAMEGLINWINSPGESFLSSNPIVRAIMAHFYLAEIHPFGDGNGRTARALEALVLFVNGINNYCFWSLANFWSANRAEYLLNLGNIFKTYNPLDFVLWGMNGYLVEISRIKDSVLKKTKQLMLMDYARYRFDTNKKENQRKLHVLQLIISKGPTTLDELVLWPEIKAMYSNLTEQTRRRDLDKLQSERLISFDKKPDGKVEVAPNYKLLDTLRYNV